MSQKSAHYNLNNAYDRTTSTIDFRKPRSATQDVSALVGNFISLIDITNAIPNNIEKLANVWFVNMMFFQKEVFNRSVKDVS